MPSSSRGSPLPASVTEATAFRAVTLDELVRFARFYDPGLARGPAVQPLLNAVDAVEPVSQHEQGQYDNCE